MLTCWKNAGVTYAASSVTYAASVLLQYCSEVTYAEDESSDPPFTSVELDHSDSGREGCTVTTLTVTAEPKNWQSAIRVAVQGVRRLKEFGVTKGELARYLDALLKDIEHLAASIENVSSVDNLDFIMESDALGHMVMDQRQGQIASVGFV